MKNLTILVFLLYTVLIFDIYPQIGVIIPVERTVDWRYPGLNSESPVSTNRLISVKKYGAKGDGISDDTYPVNKAIEEAKNNTTGISVVYFPEGNYYLTGTLSIGSNIVLKGAGSEKTQLSFLVNTSQSPIVFQGSAEGSFISVNAGYARGSKMIGLTQKPNSISPGDYIELIMSNGNWRQENTSEFNPQDYVGQIIKIEAVSDVYLTLKDKLSIEYNVSPRVRKIFPVINSGIEDLKITRISNGKGSGSNIIMNLAARCWMKGVESDNTARYHMEVSRSTEIEIRGCYFHHAEDYGDGGYGYGIAVNFHSTNCLIENNIFRRLRHSMLLQLGANKNVFGYNYSREQHSTYIEPIGGNQITTTLGDLNVHAHFPYANLFEGNIIETISVDDYWGDNGPFNTFFRNRVTRIDNLIQLGGIHIQANYQNIIGNVLEDINDQFYNTQKYYSNLNNYNGQPGSTSDAACNDVSYYYESKPQFLDGFTWPPVGTRNAVSTLSQSNPASIRWNLPIKTVPVIDISRWTISVETPKLILPANGAVGITSPTMFKWQRIVGADKYIFELSEFNDFRDVYIKDSSVVDSSITISALLPNSHYYWRVKAKSDFGISEYSQIYDFATKKSEAFRISGIINYYNDINLPVQNVDIFLENSSGGVIKTASNKDGNFEFLNLINGRYYLYCSKTGQSGGLNSADALMVSKSYVGMIQLDNLQALCADVNNDNNINSSDALFIQKKFLNQNLAFPNNKPEWVFLLQGNNFQKSHMHDKDTLLINSSDLFLSIKCLCTGDVNKSFMK